MILPGSQEPISFFEDRIKEGGEKMKNRAIFFYRNGFNCAQCILKAAEETFHIPISRQCLDSCSAVNSGFGIGGMCSVLIAGILVFGILFDSTTAKRLRLMLLSSFQERHQGMSCGHIKKSRGEQESCEEIVGEVAEMIEELICRENCRKI